MELARIAGATDISLKLPEDTTFEQWAEVGEGLCKMEEATQWLIGDWWAFGGESGRYGARTKVLRDLEESGRQVPSVGGAKNLATICRKFETSRRRDLLSFSHHREVAALPPPDADQLLDKAEELSWGREKLRAEVRKVQAEAKKAQAASASKVLGLIAHTTNEASAPAEREFAERRLQQIEQETGKTREELAKDAEKHKTDPLDNEKRFREWFEDTKRLFTRAPSWSPHYAFMMLCNKSKKEPEEMMKIVLETMEADEDFQKLKV